MELKTKQGLQTLRRAHAFLAGKDFTAAVGDLKPHLESLDIIVVRLEQFATEQSARNSAARTATDKKRALARELRQEYLRPIAYVGRHLFAHDAQLRQAFRLSGTRDDEGLIQTANAFAERVEEFKDTFAARGMAVDLGERLRRATNAFRDELTNRSLDLARRSAATSGLVVELSRGRDLVRLLDLMLAPRLVDQPETLAEWRAIGRFVRSATVASAAGDAPPAAKRGTTRPASADRAA